MDRQSGRGWLIAAGVLAAGAAAFAVMSFLSLSSVRSDRDDVAATLTSVEAEVAEAAAERSDAVVAVAAAEDDLRAAERAAADAALGVDTAERRESELGVAEQQAVTQEADLRAAAAGYAAAADAAVAAIEDHLDLAGQMADLREEQVEAVAAGHYRTFNSLQDRYNGLAERFNDQSESVAAALMALPGFEYRGFASSDAPPTPATVAVMEGDLDPPSGPARVEGSFPESIPCTPRSDGCRWNWEITLTETNALPVTISRLGISYTDRRGSVWVSQSGEWRDVTITIPALGTRTWDNWVQSLDPDSEGNLQGGTLQVRWEGTDAEGNAITGRARVTLEWRDDD